MAKNIIIKNPILRKQYSYQLDDVALNFTLRQDNLHEIKLFEKLLVAALEDVRKDMEMIQK